ncbi:hypothetical protein DY000_02039184 [Brassica cretica]|uniref:Uncharacterized protein n=1 Tax=Brassica cretica TaxID=69181 RepID=A0ABQ7BSI0_BRACR|nr:hypothetical protein DY000_02039184 [Brassica cretica]
MQLRSYLDIKVELKSGEISRSSLNVNVLTKAEERERNLMITDCLTKQFTEFVACHHHPLRRVVNCFAISSSNSRPQ